MTTPRFRMTADRDAAVRLRFDDPEFLAALDRDADDSDDDVKHPLARLLDVKRASDFDFKPYTEVGFYILARVSVPGNAEKNLFTDARKGDSVDIALFNAKRWALWAIGVGANDGVEFVAADAAAFANMASDDKAKRQQGFSSLERRFQDLLTCRLRVHIDQSGRPAERDPISAETDMGF